MPVIYAKNPPKNRRPKKDVYLTPPDLCKAVVERIADDYGSLVYKFVLDPGAGTGRWGDAIRQTQTIFFAPLIHGVEIRKLSQPGTYDSWQRADFAVDRIEFFPTLVIGNPPFKLAEQFVRHSWELLSESGLIVFLLPATFPHGQKRTRGLFTEIPPCKIYFLSQRPNFDGMGDSNTDDYVVMVWQKRATGFIRPRDFDFLDWKAG